MLALNLGVSIDSQNNQDQQRPGKPPTIRLGSHGRPGPVGSPGAEYFFKILNSTATGPDGYPGDDPIPTTSTSLPQNCRPTSVCENINTNIRGIVSFANMSCFYYMIGGHYKCFGAEN